MKSIKKLLVSTSPQQNSRRQLEVNFKEKTMTLDCEGESLTTKSLSEDILDQVYDLLDPILALDAKAYRGMITLEGFYWEIDLVDLDDEVVEIEGINVVDEKFLAILTSLEKILSIDLQSDRFIGA